MWACSSTRWLPGNRSAIAAYEGAGFRRIGCIEDGFRLKSGELSDMYIYYYHF